MEKKAARSNFHSEIDQKGSKVYRLRGSLFFGSVKNFSDLFTPAQDPDDVIIDFHYARVFDHFRHRGYQLTSRKDM